MRNVPRTAKERKGIADANLDEDLRQRTDRRDLYMRQMAHNRALAKKVGKAILVVENAVRALRRAARALGELDEIRKRSPFNVSSSAEATPPSPRSKPQESPLEVLARAVEKGTLGNLRDEIRGLRKPGKPPHLARQGLIWELDQFLRLTDEQIAKKLIALGYDGGPLRTVKERVRVELNRISRDRGRVVSELRRIDDEMAGRDQDATATIMLHSALDLARAEDHAGALSRIGGFRKDLPMISPEVRSLLERVESMSEGALRRREAAARAVDTPVGLGGLYSALAKFSLG